MRAVVIFLLMLALVSCVVPEEPEKEYIPEQTEEVEVTESPAQPPPNPPEKSSGCDLYGTYWGTLDGKVLPIPVECNLYYFDKGRPPVEIDEDLLQIEKVANES